MKIQTEGTNGDIFSIEMDGLDQVDGGDVFVIASDVDFEGDETRSMHIDRDTFKVWLRATAAALGMTIS